MKIRLNEHQLNIIKEAIENAPYDIPIKLNQDEALKLADDLERQGLTYDAVDLRDRLFSDYNAKIVQPDKNLLRALKTGNKNDIDSQYASLVKAISSNMNYLIRQEEKFYSKETFLQLFVKVSVKQNKQNTGSTTREKKYGEGSILRFFLILLNNPYAMQRILTEPETKEELEIGRKTYEWMLRTEKYVGNGLIPMESYIKGLLDKRKNVIKNDQNLKDMVKEPYVEPEYDADKVATWNIWKPVNGFEK